MYKFMLLFNHPAAPEAFETAYNQLLAGIEAMPDVRRRQVVTVMGSPQGETPLYRILEVYFDDENVMMASLRSPAGQQAGSRLSAFPGGAFQMIFADVYEEDGGATPPVSAPATAPVSLPPSDLSGTVALEDSPPLP